MTSVASTDLATGWIIIGLAFVGLLAGITAMCWLGLKWLDREDAIAHERQKGILW